jgi:hypothetical protein
MTAKVAIAREMTEDMINQLQENIRVVEVTPQK